MAFRREGGGTSVPIQPRPENPGPLTITVTPGDDDALVSFVQASGGEVDNYTVEDEDRAVVQTLDPTDRSFLLTGLDPVTDYGFWLVAHGRGDTAQFFDFTTTGTTPHPEVTAVTGVSLTNVSSSTTRLQLTAVSNASTSDTHIFDVLGDGLPAVEQTGAGSKTLTRDLPRDPTDDYTVTVQINARIGSETSSPAFIAGPYTIPQQSGSLPAQTPVSGRQLVPSPTTLANRFVTGPGLSAKQSCIEGLSSPSAQGAPCGTVSNCSADGVNGGQGIFGNTLNVANLDVYNAGGRTPDNWNGHFFYIRQGIWSDITLHPSPYETTGTYSLHARAGTIAGDIWHECYRMRDLTNRNAVIGAGTGAPIRDILYEDFEKLGGGVFYLGGLTSPGGTAPSGGTHFKGIFRRCQFNNLDINGPWATLLLFEDCTYTGTLNVAANVSGNVQGINQPGGLVAV